MKLVKLLLEAIVLSVICSLISSTETNTSTNTKMRMQNLQKLLSDYQTFNKKAEKYQNGIIE